jgi:hypothetical protein
MLAGERGPTPRPTYARLVEGADASDVSVSLSSATGVARAPGIHRSTARRLPPAASSSESTPGACRLCRGRATVRTCKWPKPCHASRACGEVSLRRFGDEPPQARQYIDRRCTAAGSPLVQAMCPSSIVDMARVRWMLFGLGDGSVL